LGFEALIHIRRDSWRNKKSRSTPVQSTATQKQATEFRISPIPYLPNSLILNSELKTLLPRRQALITEVTHLSPKRTWRERLNLSRWAIAHPRLTVSFWLAVVVAGIFAFSSLKYALFPDVTFPIVVVQAKAPGETALATEAKLAIPLEEAIASLEGLSQYRTSSYPGQTVATLEFAVGTNLDESATVVETQLQQAKLPADATFETIPFNLNESAAVSYAIESEGKTLEELTVVAKEKILPAIAQLPGVLRVDLLGDDSPVEASENPTTSEKIDSRQSLVRFNGKNALAFRVIKESDANTLEVVSHVETAVRDLQPQLADAQLTLAENQADYIREATQATIDALLVAIVLAVLVIFPFLRNIQATLITALAIPISLLGTCIVMAIAGFNLETITLLALALVIGIIVDDAIVDVENISRHLENGESPRQAAIKGTDEIGLTVSASTLTIVAVFLPVALMGGTIGQFFKPFGLTVSAAVLISLLVARTLSPVLAVWWLRSKFRVQNSEFRIEGTGNREEAIGNSGQTPRRAQAERPRAAGRRKGMREEQGNADQEREQTPGSHQFPNSPIPQFPSLPISPSPQSPYRSLLQWSLNHRGIAIALAILSFVVGVALIPLIPQGFIPKLDRGEFNIVYSSPLPQLPSTKEAEEPVAEPPPTSEPAAEDEMFGEGSFDWLTDLANSPEKILLNQSRKVAEQIEEKVLESPAVTSSFAVVGGRGEPNRGQLYIKLKRERTATTAEIQEEIRAALPELSNVTVSVEDLQFVDTASEKPLQIALLGEDLETLTQAARELQSRVEALPGFVEVAVTAEENADSPGQIDRLNGKRSVYFSANLSEGKALGDATDEAIAIAQSLIPPSIELDLKGEAASSNSVINSFAGTLTLAVACMLGLLVLLFGRLLEPLVVGLSLPLSIVGAMFALLITQSDFGMISLIGLIFLLGLLDKNALLLMDYANQLRKAGLSRTEAILQTGQVRLRPILMTTFSTILGMLPIALGFGAGAELRQPMAVAIIGGLLTSSLLSLIVVPVLYSLLEDVWDGLLQVFGRRKLSRKR